MKKTLKSLTAHKFALFVAGIVVANTLIFIGAEMQVSRWVGTIVMEDKSRLTRFLQSQNTVQIRTTDYLQDFEIEACNGRCFDYKFELQPPNANLLFSEASPVKTRLHRFYALDERCTLVFFNPDKLTLSSMSLSCVY
ncbi:hypothetical protein GCE9029_00934 [Grimontia celer]|uniref:Uncharacterized protein n=1 Tax=Grimontia celer TaxID=1796497 RepID=A0A128EVH9_9GAMM|nr:hypothetical protein [Grimontia celer]CZF78588.1 hypothetical protein GCE9029_00934 [Grimontia celer]